jgi:serine/threonine protein kinase
VDIYCTRPGCAKPINSFPDLDTAGTIKTITQKFCTTCGMPLILSGRYITEKPLARGGFGATFTAVDRYTPSMRRCVVKQLLPVGLTPQQMQLATTLFEREGTVLDMLGNHPQIPDLLAFFEVQAPSRQPGSQEQFFYLVQEYIDGLNLEQVVEQHGALREEEVLEIVNSLLPVLQFVHDRESIHRDIKPSNIMVRRQDGRYFLIDFGAVKQVTGIAVGQKSTGIFTPGFAAPEQMRSDAVFPSTDLYAFAVTCIYMLTGKPPEDLFDPATNRWNWRSQAVVSPHLANILDRMLENSPSDRFASAKEVLAALTGNPAIPPVLIPSATPAAVSVSPVSAPPAPVTPTPVKVKAPSPPAVPSPPLVLPPLGNQLFAAFLIGFEGMALGLVTHSIGMAILGPFSYLILLGVILVILWLRSSQVMDNKDLLFFVVLTVVLLWLGKWVFNLQSQPFPEIMLLAAIAGFGTIAIVALFRLLYQTIYGLL